MIENKLAIFIITYNRTAKLINTLHKLALSPFSNCQICVLDNNSTDDTYKNCEIFYIKLKNFRVIRNKFNFGLSPNYLKAVELSNLEYSWILGDDDNLNFENVKDIMDSIINSRCDLVVVGAVNNRNWQLGTYTSTQKLVSLGFPYFYITGLISGVIFRTSNFDSDCFIFGYKNSDNYFPHFYFYLMNLLKDVKVYVAENWVISERDSSGSYGKLGSEMKRGWMLSTRFIGDKKIRTSALEQILADGMGKNYFFYVKQLVYLFFIHKIILPQTFSINWFQIFAVSTWKFKVALLPSGIIGLIPAKFLIYIRKLLSFFYKSKPKTVAEIKIQLDERRT
ncbi:MAG: glycosyltransferase family 2 protein [Ignavibacteriaceae bacterium]